MKRIMQWVIRAVTAFDWPLLSLLVLMTILGTVSYTHLTLPTNREV